VARETHKRKETKTEFLRRWLGRNPDLDYRQINRMWAKAGHAGQISNALFYQVRSKMGIHTEWRWVKESEPEATEPARAAAPRKNRPNDDLVGAAEAFLPHILMFYKRFEDKRPVMLLDLPSQLIYAYPYEGFKADLSPRSQAMLESQYERALAEDKIVVFVRDNETRRLVSMSFDKE
jgi:hypothetical protein